ncbi:hypothetical protein CHUAL_007357 [Chamberlinius hualienensis]
MLRMNIFRVFQNTFVVVLLCVYCMKCDEKSGASAAVQSNNAAAPSGNVDNVEKSDITAKKTLEFNGNRNQHVPGSNDRTHFNGGVARGSQFLISKQSACAEDVRRICDESLLRNNFAVLECVQNYKKTEEAELSPECHHLLWAYKRNSTKDIRFAEAAQQVCSEEISKFTDCGGQDEESGHLLSCLMDAQDNITNPRCKQFLTKMESIVFSDYRLIYKFADACDKDIQKFRCGRLETNDNSPHSQGSTIECLSKNPKDLSSNCQHEILRVAELQSEDFHLDRPLFFACRVDRDRYCDSVSSGDGRVYRCLIRHKMEKDFSQLCREKLTQRQQLSAFDYKINKGLAKACREDIRTYRCRDETSKNREIRLAQILRCLENVVHKGDTVAGECQAEMMDHRRSLMDDYHLSPNVVSACKDEIEKFCGERLEGNSRTIHCLMNHARTTTRKNKRLSKGCKRELEELIREVNPGGDWRVDPALKEACGSVVNVACRDTTKPGEGRVLSCLMDTIGTNYMTEDCEDKLLQIQYFVARDYRLDPMLYKNCQQDAKRLCNAGENWAEDPQKLGPERGPILPCLFRYTYHPKEDQKLAVHCSQEVKRVMRQRAISVDLHPEIETACLNDLANACLEKVNKGEELECLQQKLEELSSDCRSAISNYTEEEAEHIELNSLLFRACQPYVKQYCEEYLTRDVDEGNIIQCLLQHKNENNLRSNHKCYTYLEHFQLISLKDYRFTFKFKEACKKDVVQYCKTVKTKPQVVMCLSEIVRNDSLQDQPHRISRECRQQLRVELFQRNEDIRLDPNLEDSCRSDREKYCHDVAPGNAQVLECLKDHQKVLTGPCYRLLFTRQIKDTYDNGVDYVLMTVCRNMLKLYCDSDPADVLSCLRDKKDDIKFDPKCRGVVLKRLAQQNQDYRLNSRLRKACFMDINKFCSKLLKGPAVEDDRALEGKVIGCLKDEFINQKLSSSCEEEVGEIIKESQLDYRQDPLLMEACKDEISHLCSSLSDSDGKGEVEECLKVQFQTSKITNILCRRQIAKLIQEGSADIHVDPILFKACILDIHHFCANVPAGKGKQLKCLLDASQKSGLLLQEDCRTMLTKRVQMFHSASQLAPVENINDIVIQVIGSPARNYFIIVGLAVVGSIFIGGLFCGRVTKRVHYEMKRK